MQLISGDSFPNTHISVLFPRTSDIAGDERYRTIISTPIIYYMNTSRLLLQIRVLDSKNFQNFLTPIMALSLQIRFTFFVDEPRKYKCLVKTIIIYFNHLCYLFLYDPELIGIVKKKSFVIVEWEELFNNFIFSNSDFSGRRYRDSNSNIFMTVPSPLYLFLNL